MHWPRLRMLRHLLQFLLLMFAWYTALTRVSDYKHHWSDVMAGAAIGISYALMVVSSLNLSLSPWTYKPLIRLLRQTSTVL